MKLEDAKKRIKYMNQMCFGNEFCDSKCEDCTLAIETAFECIDGYIVAREVARNMVHTVRGEVE